MPASTTITAISSRIWISPPNCIAAHESKQPHNYQVMCGFDPEDTPGIGTYYDFMNRIIDGPYQERSEGEMRRSAFNSGLHRRSFEDEKKEKEQKRTPYHSQSEQLAEKLLAEAD